MQFVRTFVLTRVTIKSFHNLSGIEGCILPPDSALTGSNVYSTSETILLAWLTMHLAKVCEAIDTIYMFNVTVSWLMPSAKPIDVVKQLLAGKVRGMFGSRRCNA